MARPYGKGRRARVIAGLALPLFAFAGFVGVDLSLLGA